MNKKVLLFGMVALLFATISCKKQETNTDTIEASIVSEDDGSRTYLYNDNRVGWSPNDVIRVWGATGDQKDYTLTDNSTDPRNGTFSCGHGGVQQGNSYLGFYPTAIFTSRSEDNITFTTLGTQTYAENTFNNNANPMVAKASTPKLPFKNVFGLLKIELKGNYTVTKIELSDPSNALWGQFTVTAGTSPLTVTKPARTAENSVLTMTCSKTLDGTIASNFYFMVPPGALSNGFTIKVYRGTNESILVDTWTTASAHTIASNQIKIVQATSTIAIPQVTNLLPELDVLYQNWVVVNHTIRNYNYDNSHYTGFKPSGNTYVILANANQVHGEGYIYTTAGHHPYLTVGHTYYLRWLSRVEQNQGDISQEMFWPERAWHIIAETKNSSINWEQKSYIFTLTQSNWQNSATNPVVDGYHQIRFDINNGSKPCQHFCFADPILIDLTADYTNQGYTIPSQATLDGKVYFFGQRNIETW